MGNNEVQQITRVIERNQEETREQFKEQKSAIKETRDEAREQSHELRESISTMAQAVADMTTTIARVEERHASHDDGLRRVGKQVDDQEKRIRVLEKDHVSQKRAFMLEQDLKNTNEQVALRGAKLATSWKAITVFGAAVVAVTGLAYGAVNLVLKITGG